MNIGRKTEKIEEAKKQLCCAEISTSKMYELLLTVQYRLIQDNIDKKNILSILKTLEHDIVLLDDEKNSINRDLFD